MSSGFSPSGSINLSSLPASVKSGDPTGLQSLTVQSVTSVSDGYQVNARLGSSTVTFTSAETPPKGSVLVGRIQNTGSGYELNVLTTPQELEQVKTQTLMNLLRRSGLNPSEGDASRLFSRLGRQGYLTASDVSGGNEGPQNTGLAGKSLTVAEGSRSVVRGMANGSVVEGTVLEAGEATAKLQVNGREVSVQTPQTLREGSVLKLQVQNPDGTPSFQVQSVRSPDDAVLTQLRDLLGLRANQETTRQLQAALVDSRGKPPSAVIEQLQLQFSSLNADTVENNRDQILQLIRKFRSSLKAEGKGGSTVQNLRNLGPQQVAQLLREMGFEPKDETIRTARQILSTDPSPNKQTLRTVLENVGLIRGNDGSIDANRLKTVLFLAKNDLPIKENLIQLLQHAAPGEGSASREMSSQFLGALAQVDTSSLDDRTAALADAARAAQFNPSGSASAESPSDQLINALKNVGFDLESQVARNTGNPADTLRSRLTAVQQVLADSATSVLQQAVSTGDSSLRDQSRTLLSQLMKHSLASVADDDSIFLFVPFPDGEGSGLMRLKFEDEGDSESVTDEEWTVTINLDLSQLGALQVRARRHREKLNLTFKASERETVSLIDDHRDRLVEELTEKGFEVSVRTRPWNEEEDLLDWDLYFDTNDFNATFDVTV